MTLKNFGVGNKRLIEPSLSRRIRRDRCRGQVIPGLNFADIREFLQAIGRQLLADQEEFFFNFTGLAGADVPF